MSKYDDVYHRLKQRIELEPERLDDWLGDSHALKSAISDMHQDGRIPKTSYPWMVMVLNLCENIDRRRRYRQTSPEHRQA
jgi:hypothetical protein